jgi:hypothetical protein
MTSTPYKSRITHAFDSSNDPVEQAILRMTMIYARLREAMNTIEALPYERDEDIDDALSSLCAFVLREDIPKDDILNSLEAALECFETARMPYEFREARTRVVEALTFVHQTWQEVMDRLYAQRLVMSTLGRAHC